MRLARLLVLGLACLAGCSNLITRGNDALKRGEFVEAADWYQRAYQIDHEPATRDRRDQARGRAFAEREQAIAVAHQGHNLAATLAALSERARLRVRWELPNQYAAAEERWIAELMAAELAPLVDGKQALAAEARLDERMRSLQLSPGATAPLVAQVHALGQRNCAAHDDAVDDDAQPYLAQLVARYCGHFGRALATAPPGDTFSAVTLLGRIDGFSGPGYAALKAGLDQALAQTGFYDPRAQRTAAVTLSGSNGQRYRAFDIVVDQPYLRQESYQDTESYTESYTTTETYTESESYTTTCYTGGHSSSCSSTRPVTRTRSVTRTRPATRWVTRWRSVPDIFHYQAVKHVGDFWCDWSATATLSGDAPLRVALRTREQEMALEHEVHFAPAHVAPSDGRLTDPLGWQSKQVSRLAADLVASGRARWQQRFCAVAAPSPETAARCARQEGPAVPPPVLAALDTLFGGETARLLALP
jgi:hypothetical protein